MTALRLEDLQLREGHWVIADLTGELGLRVGPHGDTVMLYPLPYPIVPASTSISNR